MNEFIPFLISFGAGAGIALLFFGILGLTIRIARNIAYPGTLIIAGMLVRFSLALLGFYLLIQYGGLLHLLNAMLAFTITRFITIQLTRLRPRQARTTTRRHTAEQRSSL